MRKITSLILSFFCIFIILFAGCTDTANENAGVSTPVPTTPVQKYSSGDIITKDSSSLSAVAVLKYDPVHDSYEIYDVTLTDSGSWNAPVNPSTRTLTRTAVEKLYSVKMENRISTQPTSIKTTKLGSSVTSQQSTSTSSSTTFISTTVIPTKDQNAVHSSVAQASASVIINGDISAINNPDKNIIGYLSVPLTIQDGGNTVDMSKMAVAFRYMNNEVSENAIATINPDVTKSPNSGEISENYLGTISSATKIMSSPNWGILNKINANSDDRLESGETFTIAIGVPTTVSPADHFVVSIRPAVGAALTLDIKMPTTGGSASKLEYSYL